MFNQRDRDRLFHRDKVNGTMRGLTKLLTPRRLNMNKRCTRFFYLFFFPRHGTTLNISRNQLVQSFCSASSLLSSSLNSSPLVHPHFTHINVCMELFIDAERSHGSTMNTFTVMTMSQMGCLNEYIVSRGINKEMDVHPPYTLAYIHLLLHEKSQ